MRGAAVSWTAALFAMSTLSCLAMAGVAWRLRRSTSAAPALTLMLLSLACWAGTDLAGLLLAAGRDDRPRFFVWALPAVAPAVVGFLWLCRVLVDPLWRPSRRTAQLLAIEPICLLVVVATSPWHSLLIAESGRRRRAELSFEPVFLVHTAYSWVVLGSGLLLVLWRCRGAPPSQQRQFITVLAAAAIPALGSAITLWRGPGSVDVSVLFAFVTAFVIFCAVFRQGVFEVVPLARARMLEYLADPVVVLDERDRLVDTNLAARDLLARADPPGRPLLGAPAEDALGGLADLASEEDGEHRFRIGPVDVDLDLRTMELVDRRGRHVGRALVARDVTELVHQRELLVDVNTTLTAQLQTIGQLRDEMAEQALRDELTGLHNRRYLRDFLEDTFAAARTSGLPLSVVMLDVDHFKQVNDQHGHRVGDRVLQRLALALTTCLQPGDLAVRHGGEEFIVVLPGSDLAAAAHRAEVIRRACTLAVPLRDDMVHVTISVGVATLGAHVTDPDGLLELADSALYEAKQAGRDRVGVSGLSARFFEPFRA